MSDDPGDPPAPRPDAGAPPHVRRRGGGEERPEIADARDAEATLREIEADRRDASADLRERAADVREARADAREAALDDLARRVGLDVPGLLDRTQQALDRQGDALDRSRDRLDRSRETLNRSRARDRRDQLEIDLEVACSVWTVPGA